jgi:hypothetical protein
MTHWAIALYERYVQLYGDPIEQPISAIAPNSESMPASPGEPRAQPSAPRSS